MSPFIFSKTCEQRRSFPPNHQDQKTPTMGCTSFQPKIHNPHRRVMSEPINDSYRHKLLPCLPHEIGTYRSRSLPEVPSETSRRNNRPLSKYAPEVPPYKNRPLPSPPLRTSEPAEREKWTAKTICTIDSESFFRHWSKIRLLKCEDVESWEEKLTFAQEMQDCWTKRKLFAHEVQDCAFNCACGML